ncbi:MAG: protein-L-isoaspartate(D-aspartate) O-methyltransferase [Proteobacteria bacterium]|nr:protein-L-isoaspartate(D-aspartate) O-methyltransferase [Pseudomonadota bacterium]
MKANVESARRQMIDQQVRAWDVLDDRVLGILAEVPRERFVPEAYRDVAFADTAIPLGHGQSMLAPKVEGRILQALALGRSDEVLEIGTGSGFFAACLARLSRHVRTLEIFPGLSQDASRALSALSVTNVTVETADASRLDESGLYDAIALTASLPVYDPRFERALRPGGRLFVVVGRAPVMEARLVTRVADDQWVSETLFETVIPPMINALQPDAFRF